MNMNLFLIDGSSIQIQLAQHKKIYSLNNYGFISNHVSSNNNFSQSPNHFMVLDAISRGMKKIDSIAKVTKLSKDEVELIVNDLRNQKLINAGC